ncbi:MAG: hypothetical protein ACETWB_09225, partial [Anaerolineae bacterium]
LPGGHVAFGPSVSTERSTELTPRARRSLRPRAGSHCFRVTGCAEAEYPPEKGVQICRLSFAEVGVAGPTRR